QLGLREPRVRIGRRTPRDRAGLGDRLPERLGAEIRRGRAALAGIDVDGDANAAIVGVLDVLDVPQARGDRQAGVVGRAGLRLPGALPAGLVEHEAHDALELRQRDALVLDAHVARMASVWVVKRGR